MIQVSCGACGAMHELADADVPPGGKTITCASCKSRIAVPGASAAARSSAALPDLPAPRRPSPLAGAGPARPAPRSPISAAAEDLPAPRPPGRAAIPDLPAPRASTPDLPAPKSPLPDLPAPTSQSARLAEATDLPAPKRMPMPVPMAAPPPMAAAAAPDLVAPKRAAPPVPPARPSGLAAQTTTGISPPKLPAKPVAKSNDIDLDDLLAPAARGGIGDLPAPRRSEPELPAPKRAQPADLPAPKRPSEVSDLPQPVANQPPSNLPAPKGFFDDLPQPARQQGSTDLPAPKGFFDDLPQPARSGKPELPAPKGFFDDIPQPARNQTALPQPVGAAAGRPGVAGNRSHTPSAPPPTADDLFNDLTPPPVMATPPALDLDDLDLGPPGPDAGPGGDAAQRARNPSASGLRSNRASNPGLKPATIPPPSGTRAANDTDAEAVPLLDLGDGPTASQIDFGKVDLPQSPSPGASGVSFKASKGSKPGGSGAQEPMALTAGAGDLALDVEETKPPPRRKRSTSLKGAKAAKAAAEAAPRPGTSRRTRVVLLVFLLLAAGGYFGYRWWKKHKQDEATAAELGRKLTTARGTLLASTPDHWRRAFADASAVFNANSHDVDAAGIAGQAAYASLFDDDGVGGEQRAKQAAAILNRALGSSLSSPELDKALALKLVQDGQPKQALDRYLDPLAKRAPADANAALYQGWARLALGDPTGAIEAFDRSAKALPKRDLPALYGRARARIDLGDYAAAREDFAAVLTRDKGHIGAQIGLALTAMTPKELAQREKDLVALVNNTKEMDKADPRLVARAYTILGDDARRGNRLDAAREYYRKAAAKAPMEIEGLRGQAELELREGKAEDADATIQKAMKLAPGDHELALVSGEIDLSRGKLDDVDAKLTTVRDAKPVNPWLKARMFILTGRLRAAQHRGEDATAAFEDAVAVADKNDLGTPLAVAAQLGTMAEADPAHAADLRARATKLLAPIEKQATDEASIAVALGVGYLAAGEAGKAETFLRIALQKGYDEIETRFQLAEALTRQHRTDDALAMLQKAFELDTNRLDIGLQLAIRYEESGRTAEAEARYGDLLGKPGVTLDIRGRAGRFFARQGKIDKARDEGAAILKAVPDHPTGLFLKGLGLFAEGKLEDARRALQEATNANKDAQFLEAFGKVNEALGRTSNDPRYKDDALRAYTDASAADPTLLEPLAGLGRLFLERRQGEKALQPLLAANKLAPADPDIQYSIGLSYQLLGRAPEALAWMGKSLAVKPRPDGFFNVGNMHYDAGKLAPAAAALTRATELGAAAERAGTAMPWLTDAYYMLGSAENDLHNDEAARKAWQAFIDRDPKDQVKVDKVKRDMLGLGHGKPRRHR